MVLTLKSSTVVFDQPIKLPKGPYRASAKNTLDGSRSIAKMRFGGSRMWLRENRPSTVRMHVRIALRVIMWIIRFHPAFFEYVLRAFGHFLLPVVAKIVLRIDL